MASNGGKNQGIGRIAIMAAAIACAALAAPGCASAGHKARSLVGADDPPKPARTVGPKFSEQDSVKANTDRRYQRMTKQKFEEDASIGPEAGSLWVMEGQGGYLFAQNQTRMIGDLLNVKVEGAPKAQVQTKARVIAKLLERLERPDPRAPAVPAGPAGSGAAAQGAGQPGGPQAASAAGASAGQPAPGAPGDPSKQEQLLAPQVVPTRIVEILKDGSYRVKGSQPFMIGKREYRTIVTGVVRSEDFDEAGVDAGKLLDAQFDIVASKRGS
jgi:flagellar L-ring protein precursor FlgH